MQRIATSVPDIAALPVNVNTDTVRADNAYEQFNQLLKERDVLLERYEQPVERPYAPPRDNSGKVSESKQASNWRDNENQQANHDSSETSKQNSELQENQSGNEQNNTIDKSAESPEQAQQEQAKQEQAESQSKQVADDSQSIKEHTKSSLEEDQSLVNEELEDEVDWLALLERVEKNALSASNKEQQLINEELDLSANETTANLSEEESLLTVPLATETQSDLAGKLFTGAELDKSHQDKVNLLAEFSKMLENLTQDAESNDRAEQLAELQGLLSELLKSEQATADNTEISLKQLEADLLSDLDLPLILGLLSNEQLPDDVNAEQMGLFDTQSELDVSETLVEQDLSAGVNPVVQDKALDMLIKLDGKKLDEALANLAERLNIGLADRQNHDKQAQLLDEDVVQRAVNLFTNGEEKAQFIANLKAGLNEMAKQLQQGREPGINLKSLVEESLGKALPNYTANAELVAVQIDVAVTSLTQTLDLASQLQAHTQQQATLTIGAERGLMRDSAQQIQIEQVKQGQQQLNFEKAANINRPEGQVQIVEKVRWMVNQNNMQADIRLDPPELGSMKVKVQLSGESASVSFVVQSQQARDVFEQNAPRLKELLEEQGIQLGQSSVEQEQNGTNAQEEQLAGGGEPTSGDLEDDTEHPEQAIINGRLGGIDYFV